MSGGGHAKVEYTGLEAKFRKLFPENHHVALAFIGGYAGLFAIYKIATMGKKKEEPVVVAVASASTGTSEVPSIFDESFEEFSKIPGNLEKYEKAVEEWANKQ